MRTLFLVFIVVILMASLAFGCTPKAAPKEMTEYNVVALYPATGATAEMMVGFYGGKQVVLGLWNDTTGKKLGIKLNLKMYDTREDPATAASLYPRVVMNDKPIVLFLGGSRVVDPVQNNLPLDKVPGINCSSLYGYSNVPHGWVFGIFGTYPHAHAAFTDWVLENWKEPRPLRIALTGMEARSITDWIDGMKKFAGTRPNVQIVAEEVVPAVGVDITPSITRIIQSQADYLYMCQSSVNIPLIYKTLAERGYLHKIRTVNLSFYGLYELLRVLPKEMLEGEYEVSPVNLLDHNTKGARLYFDNYQQYAPQLKWGSTTAFGVAMGVVLTQAVEKAAAKVGAQNITGQAMYDVLDAGSFSGLGLVGDVQFDPADRLAGGKAVIVYQVKGGEVTAATDWIPLPTIPKWW